MNEIIEKIAVELGVSPTQLAKDLWQVAEWIEQNRNRGFTLVQLQATGVDQPVYMLKEEAHAALDGVVFESFDGPRTRRYSLGWMVRKNPNWRIPWQARYGEYAPERVALVQQWQAEIEATRAAEVAKPKRKTERFSEGRFEEFTSLQIAYRAAVAWVLYQRYQTMRFHKILSTECNQYRYLASAWWREYSLMTDELLYRIEAEPEARSSKKKTRQAVEDFARAKALLDAGEEYFFSKDYIAQVLESVEEADLQVDLEHLPRQPLEKTPVRWMREIDVVKSFMGFLNGAEAGSFEWDDAQLILTTLRKMLARAKGQKIDEGPEAKISAGATD